MALETLLLKLLQLGGLFVNPYEIIAMLLKAVQETDLDDRVAAYLANEVKAAIPGKAIEPEVAEFIRTFANKLDTTENAS